MLDTIVSAVASFFASRARKSNPALPADFETKVTAAVNDTLAAAKDVAVLVHDIVGLVAQAKAK